MKYISRFTVTVVAVGYLLLCLSANADDAEMLAKLDEQLAELKDYNYQRSGNSLRDMEQTIFRLAPDSPLRGAVEQKLIDALDSSNTVGRGVICRQLRVVGTDRCVPALAPMLTDPELSHFARYALEGIASDAALEAMLDAVSKASGSLQVGLLNSLSNCKHEPMRDVSVRLMASDDPEVAAAAIRALGRLGGADSIFDLALARATATKQLAADIDLALLNCAEMSLNDGNGESVAKIYASLYESNGPFRLAGLRGLVIAQPEKAADLLVSAISQDDAQLTRFAIDLTAHVKGGDATSKFVGLLDKLPVEAKVLMLKTLGARGDVKAVPALAEASTSGDEETRFAAIAALGGLSDPAALQALLLAAVNGDESSQRIARASLQRIGGADTHLAAVAESNKDGFNVEAIRALAARKANGTTPLMLKLARDDSSAKRAAAIDALGLLGDESTIGPLVQLALKPSSPGDLPALEKAMGRVLMRITPAAKRATPLLDALPKASAKLRPVLVRQLSKAGTPEAMTAVRKALRSSNHAESDAAVAALADWPDSAAGDDLIKLVESGRTQEQKTMALKGYLRIASAAENSSAMFLDVLNKVQTVNNKKLVLEEIGLNCESLDAIGMTQTLFDSPQLKAAAGIATIRIAYKLRSSQKEEARKVLENVIAKVDHPDVQRRAQDVLNDIDKYEDHIRDWVAVGPFTHEKIVNGEQSYKTVFEPEKTHATDLQWKPLTLGIGSWDINLEATYGSLDHCAAYVRTMVWSPIDQEVQIEGGADDALRIWVNGELAHDQYSVHGAAPRQILAPAKLLKGWNELKLKVVDHEGGWVFGCRVRKPNGAKLEGLKYEAR